MATCAAFNLHAEAPSAREAIKRIEEAFYFAIQFPDFVAQHQSQLAGLLSKSSARISGEYLEIDATRFLENVRNHAAPPAALGN